ncbi:MAG: putative toxin-antitoxin system toxin component, PIN family [Acidobacteria bacterium]|nr:putative toxin-antitoxin system toxin component, PIN family [Acidobacteriota bacterium]
MADKYVVVFDTNIYLQALVSKGGPAVKCLDYFEQGKLTIAVSRDTLDELEEVTSRPHLRTKYPKLTDELVAALISRLRYRGKYLRQVKQRFTYPRDPKDEPQLNLAIAAKAHYLISRDNDLLDLMDWNKPDGREFQRRFRWLKIVKPEEFLQVMEGN